MLSVLPSRCCAGCGLAFEDADLVSDGLNEYCHNCWDGMGALEVWFEDRVDENPELEVVEPSIVSEASVYDCIDELRMILDEVLPKNGGVVRFSYIKMDGSRRHARAEYHHYVRHGKPRQRDPDIITYYDADKRNYRCFHEDQMTNAMPKWSKS